MPVKTTKETAIVEAAARLFAERGYQETSVADIAREAGVALQTVYNAVGAKREVLFRVLEHAAAGDEAPTPIRQFMQERTEREPDPRKIVALMVEFFAGALQRTAAHPADDPRGRRARPRGRPPGAARGRRDGGATTRWAPRSCTSAAPCATA